MPKKKPIINSLNYHLHPLTTETYHDYLFDNATVQPMLGYLDATDDYSKALSLMLENAKNFRTFKKELKEFIADRKQFFDFVSDDFVEETMSFKSLPNFPLP